MKNNDDSLVTLHNYSQCNVEKHAVSGFVICKSGVSPRIMYWHRPSVAQPQVFKHKIVEAC